MMQIELSDFQELSSTKSVETTEGLQECADSSYTYNIYQTKLHSKRINFIYANINCTMCSVAGNKLTN